MKLPDKICNLRDIAHDLPSNWPLLRHQAYFDWAKAVVDQVRGTSAPLEFSFEAADLLTSRNSTIDKNSFSWDQGGII